MRQRNACRVRHRQNATAFGPTEPNIYSRNTCLAVNNRLPHFQVG